MGKYDRNWVSFQHYTNTRSPHRRCDSGLWDKEYEENQKDGALNTIIYQLDFSRIHEKLFGCTFSAEFLHPNNYTERINLGVEYTLIKMLSLRGGYQTNMDLGGFSGGICITPPSIGGTNIKIGYSYSVLDIFDGVNRFSIGFSM